AEALVESPESMERVTRALWRRRSAAIPAPRRPRLRLALALVLLVGLITVAGAAVVRRVLQSQTKGSAHAPSALKVRRGASPPRPAPPPPVNQAKGHGPQVIGDQRSKIARSSPASSDRSGAATDDAGPTPAPPPAAPVITPSVVPAASG